MHSAQSTTIGESAAYVVHEVNQPLAAIVISAEIALELLMGDPPNLDQAKQAIERVIGNSFRAADGARSALDQIRQSPRVVAELDLNDVIRDALDMTSLSLRRRGIAVETDLAGSPVPVRGDRVQLQRLVGNLIANAMDAMSAVEERQRSLRISTALNESGDVLVAVADSGTGLDPAKIERIFDPHFTTKVECMGLGLPICRSIVESHGGRLWAAPNFPHGSIFRFTLQARAAPRQRGRTSPSTQTEITAETTVSLERNLMVMASRESPARYPVTPATNGQAHDQSTYRH